MRERRGISMMETLVAAALALPILVVAWNALLSARVAEDGAALYAAVRGGSLLEQYLERDLQSLDVTCGGSACTTAPGRLTLALAVPRTGPGRRLVATMSVTYTFVPSGASPHGTALACFRDGERIDGALFERVDATVVGTATERWLQVHLVSLDPGLRRGRDGRTIRYETTMLVPIARTLRASFLLDYRG